ncbi:MAG: aminotransferase class IV, partial [Mycobacteriales bacterium]
AWRKRSDGEAGVKLMCSRGSEYAPELGPTVWSMAFGISPTLIRKRQEGVAVVSLSFGYSTAERERSPWLLGGAKTLSYAVNMAAIRYAAETGFDDVLLTSSDGYVLEGPTSTVVWSVGDTLFTVPHYTGILPGTTVGYLTENAHTLGLKTEERMITVDELTQADAAWLCSSVRGIIEITSLDGAELGRSPLHGALARLLGFPDNAVYS